METNVPPEATFALFAAAYAGDTEFLLRYATAGGDLEALEIGPGSNGRTLLGIAAHEGHVEMVRLLLERSAEPNAVGQNGMRPIQEAVWSADSEILRLLLERGATLIVRDEQGSRSLVTLHWMNLTPLQEERGIVGHVRIVAGEDKTDFYFRTAEPPGAEWEATPEVRGNRAVVQTLLGGGAVLEHDWDWPPLKSVVYKRRADDPGDATAGGTRRDCQSARW